jgi:two-component system, NarL family, nitrate/nitrite response regulator NarL
MDWLTTEQMADQVWCATRTAGTHLQNLLTKLGVHPRLEVAALMTASASEATWPSTCADARRLVHLT